MQENTAAIYIPFESYPDLMTVDDIQTALGIGRNTAYKFINGGDIQCLKIGRSIRVPKQYLVDFVYRSCYNDLGNGKQICAGAVIDRRLT
ncbi:hypothetical protein SDC9_44338 [bioreactor metagenome]|uniref:Helix-turn-helix domain-containing protein n=1 Tax=bioreactor metagenome TaxID=1076179 RepID=A0A644W3I7_9ZZZZ